MYDAEKEERQLQDARQRELLRIEETKQKAAQLGQASTGFALLFKKLVQIWPISLASLLQTVAVDLSIQT